MKVVFCGPPHSGKSVFLTNLVSKMPSDGYTLIRACPDGEGIWSQNDGQHIITIVRKKGEFTKEFIDRVCDIIDRQQNEIVLVDVGGIISKENEEIFKHCDNFVVLSNNEEKKNDWVKFGEGLGLECLGVLDSKLEGEEEIYTDKPYLQGKVTELERGKKKKSEIIDNLSSQLIFKSGYEEKDYVQTSDDEIIIDNTQIGTELGCVTEELVDVKDDKEYRNLVYVEDENGNLTKKMIIKKVNWTKDVMPDLNDLVKSKVSEGKKVKINGVRANFVLSTICCSCRKKNVESIETYDSNSNSYIEVKELVQEENITEAPGLRYDLFENGENVFMNVDIPDGVYTKEQYEKCVIPKLYKDKKLYLSGKLPNWLLVSIVSSYDLNKVYTFQPGKDFTCVNSVDEKQIGEEIEEIPGLSVEECLEECKKRREEIANSGIEI